jgi:hypothetical protein
VPSERESRYRQVFFASAAGGLANTKNPADRKVERGFLQRTVQPSVRIALNAGKFVDRPLRSYASCFQVVCFRIRPATRAFFPTFCDHSDTNSTSSTDANDVHLLFTPIDNVVVTPEPSTLVLCVVGLLGG